MLTTGHTPLDLRPEPGSDLAVTSRPSAPGDAPRWLRMLAVGLGALGTLLALVFPLLPVHQETAELRWPTATHGTAPVTAPLVSYRPEALRASIGCAAIRDLDARTTGRAVVLSTTPPTAPSGPLVGMTLLVNDGTLTLTNRGQQLTTRAGVPAGRCAVTIVSDVDHTTVNIGDTQLVSQDGDHRPQVVGVYSDLDASRDAVAGTDVQITADTRFVTTASVGKVVAGVLAVLAFLGSIVALHALDVRAGRRAPRLAPRGWWRPTTRDLAVVGVLAVWLLIGSLTSDDGYILTMARVREDTGYVGNYYRWFDVPEAPFGWFYELYSVWVRVSTAAPWLRLPSFAMGVFSWLLISREMLPRLGQQVRRSKAASWAAAGVFCCFWLPYNNGLRPEPVVVISALLALCAVERAVATRRLVPLALGLVAAAFAVAATPTGVIALAPFLAAGRPLLRLVRERAAFGWSTVLAPIAAAGTVVFVAVFADQTLAAVLEATRIRAQIGPNLGWFQEAARYQALFSQSADGSLARRFPVLLLLLCAAVCLVLLLRRDKIPGAALGPSRRLIGATLVSFLLLALTPTKWTHHFGSFAALGAGMAALAALATSASVLRSRRNRSIFLAAVFGAVALAFTGPNTWWYVSNWGVFSSQTAPDIAGKSIASLLLVAVAACLVTAAVEHMRGLETDRAPRPPGRPGRLARIEGRGRALRLGSAPLAVICGLFVLFEIGSMVRGMQAQAGSYSLGGDTLAHLPHTSCGLSDSVLVERHPADGVLTPLSAIVPASIDPRNAPIVTGFVRNGVPPVGGGTGASGQDYALDNGLGGDDAPVLGSYDVEGRSTGVLRTSWYRLPVAAQRGDVPLVVSAAGRLKDGNTLTLEFGLRTSNGVQVVDSAVLTDDKSGEPGWRDLRVDLAQRPGGVADEVRLVAEDRSLGVDGWLAVTPPRVPRLTPLAQLVGRATPMYLEWPVGLPNPCLQPFSVHDGIAQLPAYQLIADDSQLRHSGLNWASPESAGPLGWIQVAAAQRVVPTYLAGQWDRDWGQLRLIEPYQPGALTPDLVTGQTDHWGWYSPGAIGDPPPGKPTLER